MGRYFPVLHDGDNKLRKIVLDAAEKKYGRIPQKEIERIEYELKIIAERECSFCFLAINSCVETSAELGYKITIRGYYGSFFITFLLGATQVNPLDNDLIFDEYLFDIDKFRIRPTINVAKEVRVQVISGLKKLFGNRNVLPCFWENNDSSFKRLEMYYLILPDGFSLASLGAQSGSNDDGNTIRNEDIVKTMHYRKLEDVGMFILAICDFEQLSILHQLYEKYGIVPAENDINNPELISYVKEVIKYPDVKEGLFELGTENMWNALELVPVSSINDIVTLSLLLHGTGTWSDNAETLLKQGYALADLPAGREDIVKYLQKCGMGRSQAVRIMKVVYKGKMADEETAGEYVEEMYEAEIPEWYIEACRKIKYMFPRSQAASYVYMDLSIVWYLKRER